MSAPASAQFRAAYDTLTTGCGGVGIANCSVVTLAGSERAKFLHNMCTNDINRLSPGEGCEAFCTDVKGKIVAHLIVLVLEDHLELLAAAQQSAQIIAHLDRYVIREDVVLQDVTDQNFWALFSGPKSAEVIGRSAGIDLAKLTRPWQSAPCCWDNQDVVVVRAGLLWPESYLVRYSHGAVEESLPAGCALVRDEAAWNALRIESSLPLFETDFTSSHLPQEIARNDLAISFNKGCYLGQETIARIDAMGHVNKQVCTLRFAESDVPELGTSLSAGGHEVGQITSASWSPHYNGPLALAMIRRGSNRIGCELESEVGRATVIDQSLVAHDR